jgi:hypothetical protein
MSPFDEKLAIQKCKSCGKEVVVCPKCEGDGTDIEGNECGRCDGKGLEIYETP